MRDPELPLDPPEPKGRVLATCEGCGEYLREGDSVYKMNTGVYTHDDEDCFKEYTLQLLDRRTIYLGDE